MVCARCDNDMKKNKFGLFECRACDAALRERTETCPVCATEFSFSELRGRKQDVFCPSCGVNVNEEE